MEILSHASPKKEDTKAEGFHISDFNLSVSSDIMAVKALNKMYSYIVITN